MYRQQARIRTTMQTNKMKRTCWGGNRCIGLRQGPGAAQGSVFAIQAEGGVQDPHGQFGVFLLNDSGNPDFRCAANGNTCGIDDDVFCRIRFFLFYLVNLDGRNSKLFHPIRKML